MKNKLPSIAVVAQTLKMLKRTICDDYRADEEETRPSMLVTIGVDPETGEWSWQTGDNSYSGGAYGYAYWGVATLYRNSNSREVAKALIDDAANQMEWE